MSYNTLQDSLLFRYVFDEQGSATANSTNNANTVVASENGNLNYSFEVTATAVGTGGSNVSMADAQANALTNANNAATNAANHDVNVINQAVSIALNNVIKMSGTVSFNPSSGNADTNYGHVTNEYLTTSSHVIVTPSSPLYDNSFYVTLGNGYFNIIITGGSSTLNNVTFSYIVLFF